MILNQALEFISPTPRKAMKLNNELTSRVIKHNSIAGFELSENSYPANYQTPVHAHEYTYFCFILEGNYTLKYRAQGHLCRPSKLLFFPSGTEHACHVHANSRCFNIQLNSQLSTYADSRSDLPVDHITQSRGELTRLALRLYRETSAFDEFSSLTVEGLVSEMMAEFLRYSDKSSDTTAPAWLLLARDIVSEEFANNLTLSSVAELASVHPTHLAREFRRHFHMTVGDFVRRRRVEFACRLLLRSQRPLIEIAHETGFFDQSHFTRVLKNATGMTPASYRATFQNR
jgi:AraC family transcriptional regulator